MKQTIVTLALTATTVNGQLNKRFAQVDKSSTNTGLKGDFLNKGGETIIAGSTAASGISILNINYQALLGPNQAQTIYTFSGYGISAPTGSTSWPVAAALSPAEGQLNYLFGTSYYNTNNGKVHVFEGSHKLWSQQQVLTPPSYTDLAKNYFGSSLTFDNENYDTLFVGCANCSTLVGKRNGAIYAYKKGSNGAWSQNQEISFTSLYQLGVFRVRADGDLLLADHQNIAADSPLSASAIGSDVLLRKGPDGKYKPEQILRSPNNKHTSSADVDDDTIVLGSGTQSYNALANAGAVYILGPTTLPPPAPGKPRPVQWSVQQVLWAPTPTATNNFGSSVAIDGDTLVVSETGSLKSYFFERDASVGKWSLQQTFTLAAAASKLNIKDGQVGIATTSGFYVFDEFQTSNCLNIFLEDQFGDGWDVAKLVVTKPDGSKDYLANRCDTENPYGVRYCPRNLEDGGLYKFSIVDGAPKAKNYWELLWRVYNEDTGTWTVANWDTKLDFHWDVDNARFVGKKAEKTLPTNITCSRCPIKPTDKPTPVLRNRHLKGNDNANNGGTVHPTLTPAPTLQTTDGLGINWQKLILKRSAVTKDYFKNDHRGASYYVSDAKSRKLIQTGSICNWETTPATCWVDLPDGEYNVRLGGALNEDKASLTWTYCKATNDLSSQTQLNIKIEDGACTILGSHGYRSFCGGVNPSTFVGLEFVVMGVQSTDSLNSNDISALSLAVSYTFNGVSIDDVHIESATPTGDGGYLVKAIVTFRQTTTGYDTLSIEGTTTLLSDIQSKMFSDGPKAIWSGLQAAEKASIFHSATSVQYISSSITGSEDISLITSSVDEVVSFADETTISTKESPSSTSSSSTEEILSYVGYGVAGVVAALIVGFFVSGRKTVESETNTRNVVSIQQPESPENSPKKRIQLKDLNLNPPSLSDLKQLVKDEDDVLKIMLSKP